MPFTLGVRAASGRRITWRESIHFSIDLLWQYLGFHFFLVLQLVGLKLLVILACSVSF